MRTTVYTDARCLLHQPGSMHPESPRRLAAILEQLKNAPLANAMVSALRPATQAQLSQVHEAPYLDALEALRGQDATLDPDTRTSQGSYEAALLSAGGAMQAVEDVMAGRTQSGFVLTRPPGHHAEKNRSMGFCLFNNVALAAEAARSAGAERVLVVDFDVHHGNGTQSAFYTRRDVLFMSSHQFPHYPGTGAADEVGEGEGRGYTVNVPLPADMGDAEYGAVFHDVFLPIGRRFQPDVVLVSAGFDPHRADPLGGMRVTERGFAAMTAALQQLAQECSQGKMVMLLEGGYDVSALSLSVHACLEVMAQDLSEEFPHEVSSKVKTAIGATLTAQKEFWRT